MSEDTMNESPLKPKKFGRKLKAMFATGLVLGIGATSVVSSWSNTEYASGGLEIAEFVVEDPDLEVTTDPAAWDRGSDTGWVSGSTGSEPLPIRFATSSTIANNIVTGWQYDSILPPNRTVATTEFWVRHSQGSQEAGQLNVDLVDASGNALDDFRYAVYVANNYNQSRPSTVAGTGGQLCRAELTATAGDGALAGGSRNNSNWSGSANTGVFVSSGGTLRPEATRRNSAVTLPGTDSLMAYPESRRVCIYVYGPSSLAEATSGGTAKPVFRVTTTPVNS